MELKVTVRKKHYKEAMYCGIGLCKNKVLTNCAIALAIREIMPDAQVTSRTINTKRIILRHDGAQLVKDFDALDKTPEKRLELPETVVTIQITDEYLDYISSDLPSMIEQIKNTEHLELVE